MPLCLFTCAHAHAFMHISHIHIYAIYTYICMIQNYVSLLVHLPLEASIDNV